MASKVFSGLSYQSPGRVFMPLVVEFNGPSSNATVLFNGARDAEVINETTGIFTVNFFDLFFGLDYMSGHITLNNGLQLFECDLDYGSYSPGAGQNYCILRTYDCAGGVLTPADPPIGYQASLCFMCRNTALDKP